MTRSPNGASPTAASAGGQIREWGGPLMGPVDIVFEAIDNSMLAIEAKLDDPRFAHDKVTLETAHLAILILRGELFTIIKREGL